MIARTTRGFAAIKSNFLLVFFLLVLPMFASGQFSSNVKPASGLFLENTFSRGNGSTVYPTLSAGFFKFFPLNGKAFQPWIPFLRTEVVFGSRKGDFYNKLTDEIEWVSTGFLAFNVFLPVRYDLAEGVFCNVGIGFQGGVARNLVFSPDQNRSVLLRTSTDPSFGLLVDINISFGQKTNACIGTRLAGTFSGFNYLINSLYIAYSIPNLSPRKPPVDKK